MPTFWRGRLTDPDEIRNRLIEQVTGRVRWRESVAWLAENGVTTIVEIGSGKALTGMAKRIDKALEAIAVGGAEDIDALLSRIATE